MKRFIKKELIFTSKFICIYLGWFYSDMNIRINKNKWLLLHFSYRINKENIF